jgi:hypothetical protein
MMYIKSILVALFFLAYTALSAQHSEISVGVHAPLYYTVGYEYNFNSKVSLNAQVGLLTKPFDEVIVKIIKTAGANKQAVNFVGDSYRIGWNFQPTLKFHFGKNYIAPYYSYLKLYADFDPAEVIQNLYGYNISGWLGSGGSDYAINSNLHNAGLLYGRRIPFSPAFELRLEASFAKTLGSDSNLRNSNGNNVPFFSDYANSELKEYYWKYGYLPSINLLFVYKINGDK